MNELGNRMKMFLSGIVAILALTSCSNNQPRVEHLKEGVRTVRDFVQTLEKDGLAVSQDSEIECAYFGGCKKRHHLYLKSLEEWIEVYEFDTATSAKAAFPDGTHTVMGNEIKVALKHNLALFVYDNHSEWEAVWRIWQTF